MSGSYPFWRRLSGDTGARPDLVNLGKQLLAELENRRRLGGPKTCVARLIAPDGSLVTARFVGDIPSIDVQTAQPKKPGRKIHFIERMYFGMVANSSNPTPTIYAVDMAEYELTVETGVRRVRDILQVAGSGTFGVDVYAMHVGDVDFASPDPRFPTSYVLHDSPAGGGENRMYRVNINTNAVEATRLVTQVNGNPGSIAVNAQRDEVYSYYGFDHQEVSNYGDLSFKATVPISLRSTSESGNTQIHRSGDFYLIVESTAGPTYTLHAVELDGHTRIPLLNVTLTNNGSPTDWYINSRGSRLFVHGHYRQFPNNPDNRTREMQITELELTVTDGVPSVTIVQPWTTVTVGHSAAGLAVSPSGKKVAYGFVAQTVGANNAHMHRVFAADTGPIVRNENTYVSPLNTHSFYVSVDDKRVYHVAYKDIVYDVNGNAIWQNPVIFVRNANLMSSVEHEFSLSGITTSDTTNGAVGGIQITMMAYVALGEKEASK